jgi:peptide-methionine (R)-S-oxide reductase
MGYYITMYESSIMLYSRRALCLSAVAISIVGCGQSNAKAKSFPFKLSDAEWRKRLSPASYQTLRKEATETPFTSPLNAEKRSGIFACKGCGQALFSSAHKYDSKTGWPSFWQPIRAAALGKKTDYNLGYARTEVHCSNCGGHQGHVFDDGPKPTGQRWCINGVALTFKPGAKA